MNSAARQLPGRRRVVNPLVAIGENRPRRRRRRAAIVGEPGGSSSPTAPKGRPLISSSLRRGTLRPVADAPSTGERIEEVFSLRNMVVEQILSGPDVAPEGYLQEQDEWIALLAGHAVLEVGDERVEMGPGDWVLLPGGVPHRVVEVHSGSNWLAVHLHPSG